MVRFALKTPYTIIVIVAMTLVIGLFSVFRLPMDILPVFRIPAVMVVTTYTGMPADMVEADISYRLERWLSQASGLDHIESRSLMGVSVLNCFFQPGFNPSNALSQISSLVMSDLHYLPPGTLPPIVMGYDPTANLPLALVELTIPGASQINLWDQGNFTVRPQLNAVDGAVAPVIFGGKIRQITIYLDRHRLVGHGLSPLDVVNVLSQENSMIPTGDAKIRNYDYSIISNGMVPTVADFNTLPVKFDGESSVLIQDVGEAKDASMIQTNAVAINGQKTVYLPIFRRIGSNALKVVEGIKKAIPKTEVFLPPGSKLTLLFDQSVKIRDAVADVVRELILGVLFASIVIYFFFSGNITPTLIAAVAIPLSLLGTMIGLYFTGQTLNLMTLGGLALVTGPLIDMAVVVLENIERYLEKGTSAYESAETGTTEVSLPVLVATLSLIIVFFPVTFFQGVGKFLFTPMALTVSIAVVISYFTAMTVVPLAASRYLHGKKEGRPHAEPSKPVQYFNAFYEKMRLRYGKILQWALKSPQVVVSLAVGAMVLTLLLVPFLGAEFFPASDSGQFFIRMRAPTGTRIELTMAAAQKVNSDIHAAFPQGWVKTVMANGGVLNSWAAAYSPNSASHDAFFEVEMARGSAGDAITRIKPVLAGDFPDMQFSYSLIDSVASALNFGALSPLDLRVSGPQLETADKIAERILSKVRRVPGVQDAFVEQKLDYPAINIDVDKIKAGYLGLSANEVIKNVVTALNSSVLFALNFWDDPVTKNSYFIGAQYPEQDIQSIQTIRNIAISPKASFASSEPTLLRNIATISETQIPVEISHYNLQRTFDIYGSIVGRDIGGVASQIDGLVKKTRLPRGYEVSWGGSVASMRRAFGDMGVGMVLAVVLIFLLMVAQLKSFVDPLVILATVPMGFIGVIWMLFLTGTTVNIQSMMGVIMLIGIVVSNSVILVDFANQRVAAGVSPRLAAEEAGMTRIRPILMTAISTVAALLPSSISGANAPLARAVIGGLLVATFMTLTFLPALYSLTKKTEKA